MFAHPSSGAAYFVEAFDKETTCSDDLGTDSLPPQDLSDCIPCHQYESLDLSVLGFGDELPDDSGWVDTGSYNMESSWARLEVTAFPEDMNRPGLSNFNAPIEWGPYYSEHRLIGHSDEDLEPPPTQSMSRLPSTSSGHTELLYLAAAPTPHWGRTCLVTQPFDPTISDNMSQTLNFSVGNSTYPPLSRSATPHALSRMPDRSETWSVGTSRTVGIHCQEPNCNKDFTLRKDLKRHIDAVHNSKTWKCIYSECSRASKWFSRKDKLILHMRTHNETQRSRNHTGHLRNRVNTTKTTEDCSARAHETTLHEVHTRPDLTAEDSRLSKLRDFKPHVCSASGCGRQFVNQHDLLRHARTIHTEHNSKSGYRCIFKDCSKRDKIWNRLDNFKKHLREQHKLDKVQRFVERSSRMNVESHGNVPFDVTTPEAFSKKMHLG